MSPAARAARAAEAAHAEAMAAHRNGMRSWGSRDGMTTATFPGNWQQGLAARALGWSVMRCPNFAHRTSAQIAARYEAWCTTEPLTGPHTSLLIIYFVEHCVHLASFPVELLLEGRVIVVYLVK